MKYDQPGDGGETNVGHHLSNNWKQMRNETMD